MDLEKYGFVVAGELRQKLVLLLTEAKTPTQLKNLVKTQDSSVARTLRSLESKNIIYLVNKEAKKGKIYVLTDDGKEIASKLSKN